MSYDSWLERPYVTGPEKLKAPEAPLPSDEEKQRLDREHERQVVERMMREIERGDK